MRFHGRGAVARLIVGDRVQLYLIEDISTTGGVRLRGVAPAPAGTAVTLLLDDRPLRASVARASATDFAVAIEYTFEGRAAMINSVYSGCYDPGVAEVRPTRVVLGLAR
ncbi:MAG: hypothetical protein E7774_06105, partial [Bradyrhizobium sp.]